MFTPTRTQSRDVFTPKNMDNYEYVFMHNNPVIEFKYFTLFIYGKPNTVSVDQLKPVYADLSRQSPTATNQTSSTQSTQILSSTPPAEIATKLGRHVHWPAKYKTDITY